MFSLFRSPRDVFYDALSDSEDVLICSAMCVQRRRRRVVKCRMAGTKTSSGIILCKSHAYHGYHDLTCPGCSETVDHFNSIRERYTILPCNHIICNACSKKWKCRCESEGFKTSCPTCRKTMEDHRETLGLPPTQTRVPPSSSHHNITQSHPAAQAIVALLNMHRDNESDFWDLMQTHGVGNDNEDT